MRLDFTNKVFVVTGGASGIGRAVVKGAVACGARVAIVDRNEVAARLLQVEIGDAVVALGADVCIETECVSAVDRTVELLGAPDVLVNSAGIIDVLRGTTRQTLTDWRRVVDVNLQGTFIMSREAARPMIKRGAGVIINIASVAGIVGFRASNAYGVAKAGVAMMTKTLALDLANKGIRVNAIAPGFIDTEMTRNLEPDLEKKDFSIERRTPLGRYGTAEEAAAVILFLASDLASFMTGAVVPVDGGWIAFGGIGNAS